MKYPEAFTLRAFPDEVFRSEERDGILYVQCRRIVRPVITRTEYDPSQDPRVEWHDFGKITEEKLRHVIGEPAPYWPDHCDHARPCDRFLGTIVTSDRKPYDVFVYRDSERNGVPDIHMCWRYGARCDQYVSPGPATKDWIARIRETRGGLPEHYEKALALTEKWIER